MTNNNSVGTGGLRKRSALLGMVLMAGLVGSMVTFASPASAAVPGLVRIAVTSAFNSVSPKSVTATCPSPKQLLGTGAEINGATGEVVIDDLRPNGGPAVAPTSVLVTAYEEDPYAFSWSVTAYAICARPVAGLSRHDVTSAAGVSPDFAGATATCPTTKKLVGTGAEINGGVGAIMLDDLRPNGNTVTAPTAVTAGAYEADPNYVPNWTITAYAICANTLAVPGLVRVDATSALSVSPDSATATASCPGTKVLVGTGAEINGAGGEVALDDLTPNGGTVTAPTAVTAWAYDSDPNYLPSWRITSYGICATA